nr:MAG TPA_asm: hypothetical protein [Caudoviricetes sp.]
MFCWKPAKSTSTLTSLNRSTSSGNRLKRCSWKKPVWPTPLTNALPRSTIRCSSCFALSTALSKPTNSRTEGAAMDIEMDNLKSELVLWYGVDPASQRDQFEAAATHGYSDEAIEVFTYIDGNAADTRDRLLMAVMMATPDTLQQRQRELYSWYCDNVKAVAREKF